MISSYFSFSGQLGCCRAEKLCQLVLFQLRVVSMVFLSVRGWSKMIRLHPSATAIRYLLNIHCESGRQPLPKQQTSRSNTLWTRRA